MSEATVALPRPLRNQLADLILGGLHDPGARRGLEALAGARQGRAGPRAPRAVPPAFPAGLLEVLEGEPRALGDAGTHARELRARARRGWQVVSARPLAAAGGPLGDALDEAAALFDAGLYFEVHEHLEPRWVGAGGEDREALQGVIQVAVGLHHLASGNRGGAQQLLGAGAQKLRGRRLAGIEMDDFARGADSCRRMILALGEDAPARFDWTAVPSFPRSPEP